MFDGFERRQIDTADATLHVVLGGTGPALFLLHGFPQTHAAWHRVAPALATTFTVIMPDLRGYGRSLGPPPDAANTAYSKRRMATDITAIADALGLARFAIAGHDRGGRVAYRLALDHPERVSGLVLLDIMSTLDTWEAMDWRAALDAYHWPFLAQDAGFVEAMIGQDPQLYLDHLLTRWQGRDAALAPEALADYRASIAKPSVIRAMAADYRAGASTDVDADQADRNIGRRLPVPLHILRGAQYAPRPMLPAWQGWADQATETVLDCGHFIAEEAPEETIAAISTHLRAGA